jgi:hypothetical protein
MARLPIFKFAGMLGFQVRPGVSMKYVIEINTQDPLAIARILAQLLAENVKFGPHAHTLLDIAGEPIGFTRLYEQHQGGFCPAFAPGGGNGGGECVFFRKCT